MNGFVVPRFIASSQPFTGTAVFILLPALGRVQRKQGQGDLVGHIRPASQLAQTLLECWGEDLDRALMLMGARLKKQLRPPEKTGILHMAVIILFPKDRSPQILCLPENFPFGCFSLLRRIFQAAALKVFDPAVIGGLIGAGESIVFLVEILLVIGRGKAFFPVKQVVDVPEQNFLCFLAG